MIVGIESASSDLSVAIAAPDGKLLAIDGWSSAGRGGHELLPHLLTLLAQGDHRLDQVAAFAVGVGPGSFTGLRVGMSLAKGMALALRRPIVGVPSLEAWLAAESHAMAAVARAGAREAYILLRGEAVPRVVDRDELPARITGAAVVAPTELAEAFGLAGSTPPHRAAAAVAATAAAQLAENPAGDDLARLEPAYLRPPRGLGQMQPAEATPWR